MSAPHVQDGPQPATLRPDPPDAVVQVTRPQPGCALVALNRPHARNGLSLALRRELLRVLEELARDADLRAVVLTGAGEAFCSGLDLRELADADPAAAVAQALQDDPAMALARFPCPVIGAVNGAAVTGGLELAIACDVLIASDRARFADTHARVGVLPGWGLSQKLQRLIGASRARELSFTGNFIDARRAEAWGLINRVVPHDELLPAALQLAADMASCLPGALRAYKRLMDDGAALPLDAALRLEKERSKEWAGSLTAAAMADRPRAVVHHGRTQLATPGRG